MSLFTQWNSIANSDMSNEQYSEFWNAYLGQEKEVYKKILEKGESTIKGIVKDLANSFDMETITFAGFLDGINTSLVEELNLENLEEETNLEFTIDFEKLFFNMHEAKANWLYELKEWNEILSKEKQKDIKKAWQATKIVIKEDKIGRNDPCPCGSGKKYKKCCGA
jgi:uncharacterized protein YecA (UPF0149 family)